MLLSIKYEKMDKNEKQEVDGFFKHKIDEDVKWRCS